MVIVYFLIGLVFTGVVFESAERTARALKKRRERKRFEDPERVRLEEENKMLKLQLGLPPERRIALEPEPYGQAQSRGLRFAQRMDGEHAKRDRETAEAELSKSLAGFAGAGAVPMIAALAALAILTKKTKRSAQREFTKRETIETYARLRARASSANEDEACQDPTSDDSN